MRVSSRTGFLFPIVSHNMAKWMIAKGTQANHNAIVYQLQPDSGKPQSLSFLKADDNIIFILDANRNLLVGNEYVSFTLNRIRR